MVIWLKESSLSGYAPSSSIQDAVPFVAATGIFLSPEDVLMMDASPLKMFSSRSASTRVL